MLPLSIYYFFFFTDPAPTEIYTLSLHDALPILLRHAPGWQARSSAGNRRDPPRRSNRTATRQASAERRSEEHTSELQSPDHLVCRLLLEKKKQQTKKNLPRQHKKQHINTEQNRK